MEEFDKLTPTELLKVGNDIKSKHDSLKDVIISDTFLIDEIQTRINNSVRELDELEQKYVKIIEIIESYV